MTGLLLFLLAGCVLDRTGQSATEAYARQLALQETRNQALQDALEDAERRIAQLEEVTRARGQEEIQRMDTLDQLRNALAGLRGELEVLEHEAQLDADANARFQEDVDFRLSWLEQRVAALEEALGLEPPPPPERRSSAEIDAALAAAGDTGGGEEPPAQDEEAGEAPGAEEQPAEPADADGLWELASEHLQAGRYKAARAVYQRFAQSFPDDARVAEARYRLGECWRAEGEYQRAILAYQEVLDKNGSSDWASWALLRQGQCFEALGQHENAELFYEDVLRLYPHSKAASEAKKLAGH